MQIILRFYQVLLCVPAQTNAAGCCITTHTALQYMQQVASNGLATVHMDMWEHVLVIWSTHTRVCMSMSTYLLQGCSGHRYAAVCRYLQLAGSCCPVKKKHVFMGGSSLPPNKHRE